MEELRLFGPVWLMQPIPYFGEPISEGWVYEPKLDGWRMQIIKYREGEVECWGRRLERKPNWTGKLGSIVAAAKRQLPLGTLLDTELSTKEGRRFIPSLFTPRGKVKPLVYVFDIIFYQNEFVGKLSLRERKGIIESIKLSPPFRLVKYKPVEDLKNHLLAMVKKGHEGLILKRLDSPYDLSRDGPLATENWRKIK